MLQLKAKRACEIARLIRRSYLRPLRDNYRMRTKSDEKRTHATSRHSPSALHLLLRIHRRVRRFRKVMSSLFGGSHGYIPSRWFHGRFLPRSVGPPHGRRGAWKPARPSLADQWKIHKLFQEKRRKSISNYSFL